ncbi:MAG: VCBS repeat-containing protein [Bacteroidia bacterium]|nr:VCBS repeat-containing protein [Bacteroidia bacterium]
MIKGRLFLIIYFFSTCWLSDGVYGQTWVDDSYEDFAKGELDAAGQNIYISRKGEIRTIRRFDLNNDGFIDLLFNSTHNFDVSVPASITTMSPNRQMETRPMQVEGSLAAEIADLNRDGYPDVVFCPNLTGVQTPHRYVTIIYGGADGWPPNRSNGLLPVNDAKAVVVADLNGDSWPDIITLNSDAWLPGQPEGNIARIYWGSKHGFILTKYKDIGIKGAFKMVTGDFDSDGVPDVAFLSENNTVHILWGEKPAKRSAATENKQEEAKSNDSVIETETKIILKTTEFKLPESGALNSGALSITAADSDGDGRIELLVGSNNNSLYIIKCNGMRKFGKPGIIPNVNASSIAVGDLDEDGSMDLVVSHFSLSRKDSTIKILWGDKGNFSSSRMSVLDAPYTVASAITDLDGDGRKDIICATYQGEKTYTTESIIYFGKGNREFERSKKGIPGSGAYHVAVIPPDKNRTTGIVISNSIKGNLNEEVPLLLYWGSADGFKADNRLEIPFGSGYNSSAADLNEDGFVDLISINSMHGGQTDNPDRGVNIFWGSKDGYDFKKHHLVLNEDNASTCNIADFNRDGYLDIVVGFFEHPDKRPTKLVIYYGSKNGFELKNRVAIPCEGRSSSPTIADFNKDGWLDIAVCSYPKDLLRIFWGGPEGFIEERQQVLELPSAIDLETADLNNDGYLDLIASSYNDKVNHHHDTGVMLFWGGPDGFKEWNAQWLPANTALGPVAADFDNDGYLDLFFPSYHADITREALPMYLYWGGVDGFTTHQRTTFTGDSGGDALAADFNHDGMTDLAVSSHANNGTHSQAISKIYYNDGKRFQSTGMKIEYLPSPGCHWMWNYDMGHIYTRKSEQTYISSMKDWDKKVNEGEISYEAIVPSGTKLTMSVRSSATKESLKEMGWRKVESGGFTVNSDDRYLQYKVTLSSDNGDRYPVLKKVSLTLK